MSDLISHSELKKAVDTWDKFGYTAQGELIRLTEKNKDLYVPYVKYQDIVNCINNAPTVCGNNPKWCENCVSKGKCASTRPQGEWIGDTDYESYQGCYEAYKCNKCGYGLHWRDYCNSDVPKNFCPNCGADMRKGGAEK